MPIKENGIRVVIQDEFQMKKDTVKMTLIDAETGIRYEHFDNLNDETGDAQIMNKLSFVKYDRIEESIGNNPGAEKWIYKSALGRMKGKA